jgi:hypothetical protein
MAHTRKYTERNLQKLLDTLVEHPSWKVAMKCIGAATTTAFKWRVESIAAQKANDRSSPFFIEWRGTWDYFHAHAGRARSENVILYEAQLREEAANGIQEPVLGPDQRPVWKEDPQYIGRDDDWIRIAEGLDADVDVTWYRLEHTADGRPVQLTKRVHIPAPLRKAVLAQDPRYRETLDVSVEHSGVVQVSKAMERLASEPRPGFEELRQLALMSPDERRAKLGALPAPVNSRGLVIPANRGVPVGDDRPDDGTEIAKPPNPRAYEVPRLNPPRPSYAKPLDQSGRGRGAPPEGGGPANAPGNVR